MVDHPFLLRWVVERMKINPRFDNLHDDTRFQDLMQRRNIPRANHDGGHGLAPARHLSEDWSQAALTIRVI
jgi:hypothetical protein